MFVIKPPPLDPPMPAVPPAPLEPAEPPVPVLPLSLALHAASPSIRTPDVKKASKETILVVFMGA
jgi:hypothetical protein